MKQTKVQKLMALAKAVIKRKNRQPQTPAKQTSLMTKQTEKPSALGSTELMLQRMAEKRMREMQGMTPEQQKNYQVEYLMRPVPHGRRKEPEKEEIQEIVKNQAELLTELQREARRKKIIASLIEKFFNWLSEPGSLLRNCILFLLLTCLFPAVVSAFNEHRPVAAFAETFMAWVAFYVSSIGALAAGIFCGLKVAKKNIALGWVVGILILYVVAFGISFAVFEIPGVGWRFKEIGGDSGSDY